MKKLSFLLLITLISTALFAQQVDRENVLLEIGTGTWCPYCPGSAMGADDLIDNGHDVAVIEYHNGDPYVTASGTYRLNYYGITGFPTAWFDGLNPYVGGSATQSLYGAYLSRVNQRLNIPTSYSLQMTGINYGLQDYEVTVTIDKVATSSASNLKLHLVVTESHIMENWQGQSHLNFVERMMVPNHYGTSIDFTSGNTVEEELTFQLDPEWVWENLEVIVFLQDNSTKEVHQAIKMDISEFGSAYDNEAGITGIINVPETNCAGMAYPTVTIRNSGNETLTSLDILCQVNDGTVETHNWTGSLGYLETTEVELSAVSFDVEDQNELVVTSENPNGHTDPYPDNDEASTTFEPAEAINSPLKLMLKLDANPTEISWEVRDYDNTVVYSGGPYDETQAYDMIIEEMELEHSACYTFHMFDAAGDGLSTPGFYNLLHSGNQVLLQGTNFGSYVGLQMNNEWTDIGEAEKSNEVVVYPNPFSGKTSIELTLSANTDVRIEMYDISGRQTLIRELGMMEAGTQVIPFDASDLEQGVYFMHIQMNEQRITKKITIN